MEQLTQCLVLLLVVCLRVSSCVSDVECSQCPVWKWLNHTSGECQCGYTVLGGIKCSEDNGSVYARFDVCVSWDTHSESVLASICKYKRTHNPVISRVFSEIPKSPYNLSYDECELNHREGVFCGDCKEGFAPSLYIFSGTCVSCTHCLQNPISLLLFVAAELLPLTVFYLVILKFRINIVSGPMLGYVIFCQAHINSVHIYPNMWEYLLSRSGKFLFHWHTNILLPLAGIWNLNFFAMFIKNLCYSCSFNNLLGVLMEYLSIMYIFILVALSFAYSKWNMRSILVSVRCCKAVFHSFDRWQDKWSAGDSVIHALATFTALLVAKVGAISTQLLSYGYVYNANGTLVKFVLTFEPSIESYTPQHAPYALAAYIPLFCFLLLPGVLLCLYPSHYFQRVLNHLCGPRLRLSLAIFVDTLIGGYRDGLDGGRDCRRFYPLLIITIMASLLILGLFFVNLPETYFIFLLPIFIFISFCILCFKPCKTKQMNASLSFHLIIVSLSVLTLSLWMQDYFLDTKMLEIFMTVCLTLPHVVMLVFLLTNILRRCYSLRNCYLKIKKLSFGRSKFLMQSFE